MTVNSVPSGDLAISNSAAVLTSHAAVARALFRTALRLAVNGYGLCLEVARQPLTPERAAQAGLLEAAERRTIRLRPAVDADPAGADRPGPGRRLVAIPEQRPGQAVRRVIGDANGVVNAVIGDHANDWSEDFLSGDAHAVVDLIEQRRVDVPPVIQAPRPVAAGHYARTLGSAGLYVGLDSVPLPAADQGPELSAGVERIADGRLPEALGERVDDRVVPGPR